jgi:predicted nucleotidyltransferase
MYSIFNARTLYEFGGFPEGSPLNFVHPYKVKGLEKILKIVPDNVEMIIVFGSSARGYQRYESDLDLAVITVDNSYVLDRKIKELGLEFKTDIHYFNSIEDLVKQAEGYSSTSKDILNDGILVYHTRKKVKFCRT